MTKKIRIIAAILTLLVLTIIGRHYYGLGMLRAKYEKSLIHEEEKFINTFYKSNLKGVITYIKQYDSKPNTYVIEITDSAKNKTTIGKVEITNFSDVFLGDTVNKKNNSYELEIHGREDVYKSLVKYK